MPIQKIIIESIMLIEADTPEKARAEIETMEPEDVVRRCDTGDAVGTFKVKSVETVHRNDVASELVALGSDSSFFPDESVGDYLAIGRVHLGINGVDETQARDAAMRLVDDIVERDDLIGSSEIEAIDPLIDDRWTVALKVMFRTQGISTEDAKSFAAERIADFVASNDAITSGMLCDVVDDRP